MSIFNIFLSNWKPLALCIFPRGIIMNKKDIFEIYSQVGHQISTDYFPKLSLYLEYLGFPATCKYLREIQKTVKCGLDVASSFAEVEFSFDFKMEKPSSQTN